MHESQSTISDILIADGDAQFSRGTEVTLNSGPRCAVSPVAGNGSRVDLNPVTPVTTSELQEALGIRSRGVRMRAQRLGLPRISDGVYDLAVWPSDVRELVMQRRRAGERRQLTEVRGVVRRYPKGPGAFTKDELALARERADFVLKVEQCKKQKPMWTYPRCVEAVAIWNDTAEKPHFLRLLGAGKKGHSALTPRNFQQWKARWEEWRSGPLDDQQYWVLADHYAHNAREREGDNRFWNCLRGLYETPTQLTLTKAFQMAHAEAAKHGWSPLPSLRQVTYWYQHKADKRALFRARFGEKAFYDSQSVYVIRNWRRVRVNQCWSGDHHQFNVFVKVWDAERNGWTRTRPWLTNWIDAASWIETGSWISTGPNRDTIEFALRDGVLRHGFAPEGLYCDNGKDYRALDFKDAHRLGYDKERIEGVCDLLGIPVENRLYALPKNPRAKINERWYVIIEQRFERAMFDGRGYCGHNAAHMDALWPKLKDLVAIHTSGPRKGLLVDQESPLVTLDEFRKLYAHFVANELHHMRSKGRILDGKTPSEKWEMRAFNPRPPLTEEQIYFAFLRPVKTQMIAQGGRVSWQPPGGRAGDTLFYRSPLLVEHVRETVDVKIDLADVSRAFVFRREDGKTGRLIQCEGPFGSVPCENLPDALSAENLRESLRAARVSDRKLREAEKVVAANQARDRIVEDVIGRGAAVPASLARAFVPEEKVASEVTARKTELAALRKKTAETFGAEVTDDLRKALRGVDGE